MVAPYHHNGIVVVRAFLEGIKNYSQTGIGIATCGKVGPSSFVKEVVLLQP
jgi:nicotinamide mononucleotide (NMN) deamidase PncC